VSLNDAGRWAWAEVDVDAIAHNVGVIRQTVAPSAVWAVVKADGYGHGAVTVGRAALDAGAEGLCVALAAEGFELRSAGIDSPILVLSEQPADQLAEMIRHRLTPTVYSTSGIAGLARAASGSGSGLDPCSVHLKVDTGMQRVGVQPEDAAELLAMIAEAPGLRLDGVYTHLACADEPESSSANDQLERFDRLLDSIGGRVAPSVHVHAANSAGAFAVPSSRRSLVRPGIALYGISPGRGVADLTRELQPVMTLKARVSFVKPVKAGSHVSYGWRHTFANDTTIATLPIGYADGVPRRLGSRPDRAGADILVGGTRCPIVGVVTMDQVMVDVGNLTVKVGDEAVLIGRQGSESIRAEEWAECLGTIGYEIVCGIGARVPRITKSR
jgi:alanine racemase